MEQNTDAVAELVKLGADRPAYTLKLLEQYQRVLDMGIAVDNALAELKELAAENERKVAARDAAVTLHFKIRNQLELLFRAAMIEVIDQRPYFNLQRLVQENKLFDSEMEERFALRAISCGTDDAGDFVIKGKIIGRKGSRNPHSFFMGPFSAEFSGEHVYDENKVWTAQDLDACFKGVYLYQLRADADTLDELSAIHAWLKEYTVAVQLSRD
jgi:hypothetical protein